MSGATKLMTAGGGGVSLTPASSIASDVTVNIPSQNCTLGIQGPAFSAYPTGTQNLTGGTNNVLTLNAEIFDTASCYNTSSYRFVPNVAGYYSFSAFVRSNNANGEFNISIYKNGSYQSVSCIQYVSGTAYAGPSCTGILYMNGSTDYVELMCYTQTTCQLTTACRFDGALVRAA